MKLRPPHLERASWAVDSSLCPEILDATDCVVLVTEVATGIVAGMNKTAEAMTGYARAEVVGRPLWETLIVPLERAGAESAYAVPDGAGIPLAYEGVLRTKSGGNRRVFWTNAFLSEGGVRTHVVGTGIDVTAENTAAGLFSHLMRTATSAAFIGTDLDGRVTYCSSGAEVMLGYTMLELVGELLPEGIFEPAQIRVRAAEYGSPENLEVLLGDVARPEEPRDWTVSRKDGTRLTAAIAVSTVTDTLGQKVGYLGVGRDVTDERRRRELLVAALDKERDAVTRLRRLDEAKSDFIETVGHELRTPLSTISGNLELLLDGVGGALTPRQVELVDAVSRSSDRLVALAEDLVMLSTADDEDVAFEQTQVDLVEVVARSQLPLEELARKQQLDLSFRVPGSPVVVMGSSVHLERVVSKIVGNAVKFTNPGGTVTCTLSVVDDRAVLDVLDTGIGIPRSEQGGLFGRFYRSSGARQRAIQGTGLGLAIVASIVHGHGGTIACESEHLRGTRLTVRLPLREAQPQAC